MKTKLFNFIIIGTLLVTGVVSAQVEAFSTPVHTGGYEQKKEGSFVASFLKAGLKALPTGIPSLAGFIIADKVISSPQGFFNTIILPVNNKGAKVLEPQLRIGTNSSDLLNATFKNDAPVTVDLSGRNTTDAVALLADPTVCTPNVSVISTNTSAFHFWSGVASGGNNDRADIIARQIQLSGGNPGAGKVLISVDSQGTATWATVRVDANGVATYDYTQSPVFDGLCQTPPTPQTPTNNDYCSNLAGSVAPVFAIETYVNVTRDPQTRVCTPKACKDPTAGNYFAGSQASLEHEDDSIMPYRSWTQPVVADNTLCQPKIEIGFTAKTRAPQLPARCSTRDVTPVDLTFTSNGVPITQFDSISFQVSLKNKVLSDYNQSGTLYSCLRDAGGSHSGPTQPVAFNDFSFVPIDHSLTQQRAADSLPKLINVFRNDGSGKYYLEVAQNLCFKSGAGGGTQCRPFDLTVRVNAVYQGKTFTKDVIIGKNRLVTQSPHNPYDHVSNTTIPAAQKYCHINYPSDDNYKCAQVRYP